MMNNVMIDIETLALTPDATILSIGAVKFDEISMGDEFYFELKPDQGRGIDPGTALWWAQQSSAFDDGLVKYGLREVIHHLNCFLLDGAHDPLENQPDFKGKIWANSPVFDLAILRDVYADRGHDLECPWKYYQERDVRTEKAFIPKDGRPTSKGRPHHALDDAKHQVELVWAFLARSGLSL